MKKGKSGAAKRKKKSQQHSPLPTPPPQHHTNGEEECDSEEGEGGGGGVKVSVAEEMGWPLHRAVWDGDLEEITRLIDMRVVPDINERDAHGNSPLHLAIHFRNQPVVQLLLEKGADPTYKNGGMWSPIQEAVASGDKRIVGDLMMALKDKVGEEFRARVPTLVKAMVELPDFYMEIHWEFKSWVPLVSMFCPYDTYKIWKQGPNLRVETTLKGFENMKWVRGDLTIMFLADPVRMEGQLCMVDHDRKVIEYMMQSLAKYTRQDIERDVAEVIRHSLMRPLARTDRMKFTPKYGWFGGEKTETVAEWNTKLYEADGFQYVTRHRNNKKKKKGYPFPQEETALTDKEAYFSTTLEDDIQNRAWGDESEEFKGNGLMYPSDYVHEKVRSFKSTVWFTDNFPRTVKDMIPIFEVLSPRNKHFEKLKDFVEILPDYGFPVKIEVPVFPTVSGTASFLKYDEDAEVDPSMFELPEGYRKVTIRRRPKNQSQSNVALNEGQEKETEETGKGKRKNRKNNNKKKIPKPKKVDESKMNAEQLAQYKEEQEALEKVSKFMRDGGEDDSEYSEEVEDYVDDDDLKKNNADVDAAVTGDPDEEPEDTTTTHPQEKMSKNARRKARKANKKK